MTTPQERTLAFINAQALMYKCATPARRGGLKKIPKDVRKSFRAVLKHWPWLIDLVTPGAFCKRTIEQWRDEMDGNWRREKSFSNYLAGAQRNGTRIKQ